MEDLYKDFIKGDEVKAIKTFLRKMDTSVITGFLLGYFVTIGFSPHLMIVVSALAVGTLFLTHFIKKWTK